MHDVRIDAIEQTGEGRADRRIVELAVGMPQVEQAVRAVVHRHDLDAVLDGRPDRVGRLALERRDPGGEDRDLVPALRELLGDVARDDGASAGVGEAEGREHDALARAPAIGAPRRGGGTLGARAPLGRKSRKQARLERVRQHEAGSALGVRARQHRPVELGHQVVEWPVGQVLAQQRLELARPLSSACSRARISGPSGTCRKRNERAARSQ